MKNLFLFICLTFVLIAASCHNANPGPPVYDPADIQQDEPHFMSYLVSAVRMYQNFTAFDTLNKPMDKLSFLKALTSGNYFPLKLQATDGKLYYQLCKFKPGADNNMRGLMSGYAPDYYDHYKRVDSKFPAFDFTDINNKHFTSENTKGKIVVLNCWFIGCEACQKEMPALNTLVQQYKNRKDVIFISLAPDSKQNLQKFFATTPFDYLKVPNQDNFMSKVLDVHEFPTHFIINKQGVIVNVVETPDEIAYSLKNDL